MKLSAAFQNFNDVGMAMTGFFLFGAVFVGAIAWTYFVRDESFFKKMGNLPLEDEATK